MCVYVYKTFQQHRLLLKTKPELTHCKCSELNVSTAVHTGRVAQKLKTEWTDSNTADILYC